MRPEAFEIVDVTSGVEGLPLLSQQSSSRPAGILNLALLSSLAAVVVIPQLALAVHALSMAPTRALIVARPLLALELAIAICFWIGIFGWPLKRLISKLNWRRDVVITRERVAVRPDRVESRVRVERPAGVGVVPRAVRGELLRLQLGGIRGEPAANAYSNNHDATFPTGLELAALRIWLQFGVRSCRTAARRYHRWSPRSPSPCWSS